VCCALGSWPNRNPKKHRAVEEALACQFVAGGRAVIAVVAGRHEEVEGYPSTTPLSCRLGPANPGRMPRVTASSKNGSDRLGPEDRDGDEDLQCASKTYAHQLFRHFFPRPS